MSLAMPLSNCRRVLLEFIAFKPTLHTKQAPWKYNIDKYVYTQGGLQPLDLVQDQGPVSQEIPPRIWRDFRENVSETLNINGTAGY